MARENQKHVNLYLPSDLYNRVVETGLPMTTAVISGLEKLLEPPREEIERSPIGSITPQVLKAKESIIKALEARTNDLNERIAGLEEQLKLKDSQLNIIDSRMEDRLRSLEEQLRVKDSQLENKDGQLEKQAVHIQTLISQKAIEAPGVKKPWWQFW
jgi:chromosome segregation ATPase